MVPESSSSSVSGQSHVTVVVVPVGGAVRVSGHEGVLLVAVVGGSHGVRGVRRSLVVVHGGNLDKRHGDGIEVRSRGDGLGLVDVRRILKLVFDICVRHGVMHGRKGEEGSRVGVMFDGLSLLLVTFLPLDVNRDHLVAARATDCAGGTPLGLNARDLAQPVVRDVVVAGLCGGDECPREPGVPLCSRGEPLGGEDGRCEEGGGSGVVGGIDGGA